MCPYVLSRNSGEGQDRFNEPGDYELLPDEKELLTTLAGSYERFIVLLNIGGVIDIPAIRAIPGINAIVLLGQAGSITGLAAADLLLGRVFPSGRLTDTWAKRYEDYPGAADFSHNNGDWHDEYYNEGIYVGYRYFDTFNIEPEYPFGYGLSYTTFTTETTKVTADGTDVSVRVRVTNTGKVCGREVVQVYGSAPSGRLEKPYQVLAGFAKTADLQPGETEELTITFPLNSLGSFDTSSAAYVLEKGTYYIRVGSHSRNTAIAAAIALDDDAVTKKVKNICPPDTELKELSAKGKTPYSYIGEEEQKKAAPVIHVTAKSVPCVTVSYAGEPEPLEAPATDDVITASDVKSGKYTMEQLVAQLTVPEMADLCVGIARTGSQGSSDIIGNAAITVPGAAGDTTRALLYRGVRNMVNADGPAGLRLQPHFRADAEGNIISGGDPFAPPTELPERKDGETDYYQYCTAIPIAWMLAGSWDTELIKTMGSIVGAEMEQFGIQIWLAPGMNIHRNPLCGRNFEYYSEDPLLSGLSAAAAVSGVQSHRGTGACIKHFFANNLEDNRFFNNSHIGEQAIREIYLRNFAVAIEASQPMCIMTSYNLVNGVHTANSYDAITCFAREENGFAGYVMTDWLTSHPTMSLKFAKSEPKYPCSSSPECIRAGNDIQMPGCRENIEDIINAVNSGELPIGYLQRCALRLIETAERL